MFNTFWGINLEKKFGEIEGIHEGTVFDSFRKLYESGVHKATSKNIVGNEHYGAESILISRENDGQKDFGDTLIITGEGGRDLNTGIRVSNQKLEGGNKALALNSYTDTPVRVIRKINKVKFRYDGLFIVSSYWAEKSESNFLIWRFRLEKLRHKMYFPRDNDTSIIKRKVKKQALAIKIKRMYNHKCQICGTTIHLPQGPYAEVIHIKPLGFPHNGPDTIENLLCLCPNHLVMFGSGIISIDDDFTLTGLKENLTVLPKHNIKVEYLEYHRNLFDLSRNRSIIKNSPQYSRTKSKIDTISNFEQIVKQFEIKLDEPNVTERDDILPFIRRNKFVILGLINNVNDNDVLHEVSLGKHKVEHRIDFIIRKPFAEYILVEFETPNKSKRLFTKSGKFTETVNKGINDIFKFKNWLCENPSIKHEELPDLAASCLTKPQGLIIVGRSNNLNEKQQGLLKGHNLLFSEKINFLTYDDLIFHIRKKINDLKNILQL